MARPKFGLVIFPRHFVPLGPSGSRHVPVTPGAKPGATSHVSDGGSGVSDAGSAAAEGGTGGSAGPGGTSGEAGGNPGIDEPAGPVTCAEASAGYVIHTSSLGLDEVGSTPPNARMTRHALALGPTARQAYVGFTRNGSAVITGPDGELVAVPDAELAGLTVTRDGVASLLFDPNRTTNDRRWAQVRRFSETGAPLHAVDLFRSGDLEVEGSKGGMTSARLGHVADTDAVVAYFGHTQRYPDGVRHQGGYLATVSAAGEQTVISGWFGSHNLDQRLLVTDSDAWVIGLGDAYPEGIFFGQVMPRARPNVILPLAAAGNGSTNGQLGGMVGFEDEILVPFITNRSLPAGFNAGTWPDIDQEAAARIREAANNGTDLGLVRVPKMSNPGAREPIWLDPERSEGARLERLKSARFGTGDLILLAWAEVTGTGRNAAVRGYYTLVIDRDGSICHPKTEFEARLGFNAGDDFVGHPDGKIRWVIEADGAMQLVTLVPR